MIEKKRERRGKEGWGKEKERRWRRGGRRDLKYGKTKSDGPLTVNLKNIGNNRNRIEVTRKKKVRMVPAVVNQRSNGYKRL